MDGRTRWGVIAVSSLAALACGSSDSDKAPRDGSGAGAELDGGASAIGGSPVGGGGSMGNAGASGAGSAGRAGSVAMGRAGASGSGATGGSGNGGGGAESSYGGGCPDELASGGCDNDGRVCTYGNDSVRPECREQITCMDGSWVASTSSCPAAASQDACPQSGPNGSVSCIGSARCLYEGGSECQCVGVWVCDPARTPQAGGCPTQIPNAGSTCQGGLRCSYPCRTLTENLVTAICSDDEIWLWELTPCATNDG